MSLALVTARPHLAVGPLRAVGLSASPSITSRSGQLVRRALAHLRDAGAATELIELGLLPADALLGRRDDAELTAALERFAGADAVVLGTPIYRGSYAGQLKVFFDLLPRDALAGTVVGAIATGGSATHTLALDHAIRPLVSSLRGLTAARGIYVSDAQMPSWDDVPPGIDEELKSMAHDLGALARVLVR